MAWDRLDLVFKKFLGKRTTHENKAPYEEFGDKAFDVHSDDVKIDDIPFNDPSQAVTDGIAEEKTLLALTEDITVPNKKAWYAFDTERLKNWIPDKYGTQYTVRLYDANDSEIFPTDDLNWLFDYSTGILLIDGNANAFDQPFKISGYRYTGKYLNELDAGVIEFDDSNTQLPGTPSNIQVAIEAIKDYIDNNPGSGSPVADILFVNNNGYGGTPEKGNPFKPWQDFDTAHDAASDGDVIYLMGMHDANGLIGLNKPELHIFAPTPADGLIHTASNPFFYVNGISNKLLICGNGTFIDSSSNTNASVVNNGTFVIEAYQFTITNQWTGGGELSRMQVKNCILDIPDNHDHIFQSAGTDGRLEIINTSIDIQNLFLSDSTIDRIFNFTAGINYLKNVNIKTSADTDTDVVLFYIGLGATTPHKAIFDGVHCDFYHNTQRMFSPLDTTVNTPEATLRGNNSCNGIIQISNQASGQDDLTFDGSGDVIDIDGNIYHGILNNINRIIGIDDDGILNDDIQLDTDAELASNSDSRIATQKAIKTYVDNLISSGDILYHEENATDAVQIEYNHNWGRIPVVICQFSDGEVFLPSRIVNTADKNTTTVYFDEPTTGIVVFHGGIDNSVTQ